MNYNTTSPSMMMDAIQVYCREYVCNYHAEKEALRIHMQDPRVILDPTLDRMIIELRADVLQERVAEGNWTVQVPSYTSWIEHFKADLLAALQAGRWKWIPTWFGAWIKKRLGVPKWRKIDVTVQHVLKFPTLQRPQSTFGPAVKVTYLDWNWEGDDE